MMSLLISAVIITHNQSGYLRKAIDSLIHQSLDEKDYEIIVVDNRSTDDTRKVVESYPQDRVRYLYEPVLGISQARNTGWRHAKSPCVAYVDDDAIADDRWMEKILSIFNSAQPRPDCIGGRIEPIWEVPRPHWLTEFVFYSLGINIHGAPSKQTILNETDYCLGTCNLAVSREVLEKIGGFKSVISRHGNRGLFGNDLLFQMELRKEGYLILFDPELTVRHHVRSFQLRPMYFLQRSFRHGIAKSVIKLYIEGADFPQRLQIAKGIIRELYYGQKHLLDFFVPGNSPERFKNKVFAMEKAGRLVGAFWRKSWRSKIGTLP